MSWHLTENIWINGGGISSNKEKPAGMSIAFGELLRKPFRNLMNFPLKIEKGDKTLSCNIISSIVIQI